LEELVAPVPPPQAASEKASATATGTVVSHFRAEFFITRSLSLQVPGIDKDDGRVSGARGALARARTSGIAELYPRN
jgi:hypothetical protein